MKNLIRGVLLGVALGATLYWYAGSGFFPAVLAVVALVAVLIPMEQQEQRLGQIEAGIQLLQKRFDQLETGDLIAAPSRGEKAPDKVDPETETFIPTIQSHLAEAKPMSQKKRTVDRSLEDMAKKLAAIQGG